MRPRTVAQPATPPDLQPPARLGAAPLHPPVLTAPPPVPEPPTTPLLRPPPLMNLRPQHPRPGQVTHHPVPHLHPQIMATVPLLMAILGPAPVRMAAHQTVTVPQLMVVLARPDRTPAALADLGRYPAGLPVRAPRLGRWRTQGSRPLVWLLWVRLS